MGPAADRNMNENLIITWERDRPWSQSAVLRSGAVAVPAFSLLEVIAAVAVFAIGMVGVLALFVPVTASIADIADAESAARVADAVRARLRTMPFDAALALVQSPADVESKDAHPAYDPSDTAGHPVVIFGTREGEIGIYDPADGRRGWFDTNDLRLPDAEMFFEIDLIRNTALTPSGEGAAATVVVVTIRVRWPAFRAGANGEAVQLGAGVNTSGARRYDHGHKQVLLFAGAIVR